MRPKKFASPKREKREAFFETLREKQKKALQQAEAPQQAPRCQAPPEAAFFQDPKDTQEKLGTGELKLGELLLVMDVEAISDALVRR